jgi:hypothetical protein
MIWHLVDSNSVGEAERHATLAQVLKQPAWKPRLSIARAARSGACLGASALCLPFLSTSITYFLYHAAKGLRRAVCCRIEFIGRVSKEKGLDLFCDPASWSVSRWPELESHFGDAVRFHGIVAANWPLEVLAVYSMLVTCRLPTKAPQIEAAPQWSAIIINTITKCLR